MSLEYAELHAHSHYSFLDGASSPDALVHEAARLGLAGLAITDHNGLQGAPRFAEAALEHPNLATVYGAELSLGLTSGQPQAPDPDATHLLALAEGLSGYRRLSLAITEGQLAGTEKGVPRFDLEQLAAEANGEWLVLTGCRKGAVRRALAGAANRADAERDAERELRLLIDLFGNDRVCVELTDHGHPGDDVRNDRLAALAARVGAPTVATPAAHAATRADTELAEAVAAIRSRRSLVELDPFLPASGGAHLRSARAMLRRFARHPDAVTRTATIARQLAFPLRAASPRLPRLEVPDGHTQMSWLRELVRQGAERRYHPLTDAIRARLENELQVIEQHDFPGYFLVVYDIVQFARGRGILCQGRGSAANAAVCYVLGITDVDSIFFGLPFERFLNSLREEKPDIDVDFESDRREEVIQYVYAKYGRRSAAQVANVISYRPRGAVRDAAKALGYSADEQRAFSKLTERRGSLPAADNSSSSRGNGNDSGEGGPSDSSRLPAAVSALANRLLTAPRHLGIHSGGMVLTDRPVSEVCPIEHARMPGRTVLQWDKDDCASMGLVKFDLLGLGMLSALQVGFDAVEAATGEHWTLATLPKEEQGVFDMLCRADAIGVFQLESRAQLNTLPRLKPRSFYDLVTEIALIRPGPLQGGAIHPYLRRRSEKEPVTYPHPLLEPVLKRTLGVPLFQEQLMHMAQAVGGCSAADADLLRRAMGSKRGLVKIETLRDKLLTGMRDNGIDKETAARVYAQIESFADFGFAESHSISFGLLVYASAWLKLHYPAAFLMGLLRSQPMGFYAPRTLVEDARRHGVEVRPADVQQATVEASLELLDLSQGALPLDFATGQAPAQPPDQPGADSLGATDEGNAEANAEASAADSAGTSPADTSAAPPAAAPTGIDACLRSTQPPVTSFDASAPDTSMTHRRDGAFAVRLGLADIRGLGRDAADRITRARHDGPFRDLADLARRADVNRAQLEALAAAGACEGLGIGRREALWNAAPAADNRERYLPGVAVHVQPPLLPMLTDAEQTALDLWTTGVVAGTHPLALLRDHLDGAGVTRSDGLRMHPNGTQIRVAGLVTHRQRPRTANGITFMTLEDEAGTTNVVVWSQVWQHWIAVARHAPALIITGMLERNPEGVTNIIADRFERLTAPPAVSSRDFR
ncbi:MAG: error-prone DNA polymerase [Microbacteriaceae bacterium]|nr:error-prone DNA polymerase [Microbacteriaceae bacterium]